MQLLLRKRTINTQGQAEFSDIELAAESIVIGSAPDCNLQLLDAQIGAQHAFIRSAGKGGARIAAAKKVKFIHNEKSVAQADLKVGDTLAFGAHKLTVVEAPSGFDLALEWVPSAVDGRYLARAYRTSLRETALRPRLTAWLIAIVVLLAAGIWPVAEYELRTHHKSAAPDQNAAPAAPMKMMRAGADTFWTAGPLHAAHRAAIGDRCEVCHAAPFRQVRDSACEACHKNMADHVEKSHPEHAQFGEFRCQSCHKEHNKPSYLVVRENNLCVDCHGTKKTPVKGFAQDTHPAFRVSVPTSKITRMQDNFSIAWSMARVEMTPTVKENSHLKFSHLQHLDGAKVQDQATGNALNCASCHRLKADKEHFEPITMQKNCIQCHDLGFDATQPQRQLPHGEVASVFEALDAHFIAKAYGQEQQVETPPRKIPNHYVVYESCKGDINCAKGQSMREATRQFTVRGCVSCHDIEEFPQADIRLRWQVVPVKLVSDWYPSAHFDHAVHLTRNGMQGDAVCTACHAAQKSKNSSDVLMPANDNCLQCHNDQHGSQQVPLQCVSCHAYHRVDNRRVDSGAKELNHAAL